MREGGGRPIKQYEIQKHGELRVAGMVENEGTRVLEVANPVKRTRLFSIKTRESGQRGSGCHGEQEVAGQQAGMRQKSSGRNPANN